MAENTCFLLTGAGFTKNLGGFLSTEMWSRLFNNPGVQRSRALRSALIADQDFESVYHKVVSAGGAEADTLVVAAFEAYKELDENLRAPTVAAAQYPLDIYHLQKFIGAFAGPQDHPGFVFTLNQDLLLERHYYNGPRPVVPGVRQSTEWFSAHFTTELSPSMFVPIDDTDHLEHTKMTFRRHHKLAYIKLHGSCNWRSAGSDLNMVLGRDKDAQIGRNPLLKWYFELFRTSLASRGARLFVTGYGFADPHINRAIAHSVRSNGLEVTVLDPTPAPELLERIRRQPDGDTILSGVRATYPLTLRDLFPPDQRDTPDWLGIQERFFGRKVR